MSKQALGQNGLELGSAAYFSSINSGVLLSSFLSHQSGTNYYGALESIATEAMSIIATIYGDLQTHYGVIRYISNERRNRLSNLVTALSDLCSLVSPDTGSARECLSLLALSGFLGMSRSMASDSELERASNVIRTGGSSGLDMFSRINAVREAVQWGETFAIGADDAKRAFLQEFKHEQSGGFMADAWDLYNYQQNPSEYCGANGCEFCSESYVSDLEYSLFPRSIVSTYLQADYAGMIRSELHSVLQQIESDVSSATGQNDYLTDDLGDELCDAVANLERCGLLGSFNLHYQIKKLCWYTPVDTSKVMNFQRELNRLRLGISIKEDGVYGTNTQSAWVEFFNNLEHGVFPTLAWVNPLQSDISRIGIGSSRDGVNNVLRNIDSGFQYFRVDPPHVNQSGVAQPGWFRGTRTKIDYNHVNIDNLPNAPSLYNTMREQYNHYPLTDEAYNALKNLESTGQVVRIAGKVLLVAGAALDVLELGTAMTADLNDADGKLGKTTVSTAASIGGRWAGAALGAKAGAAAGAAIGTAIFPGVGTAVGGAVLGLAGGITGAFGGDALAGWVVDITYVGE